MHVIRAAAFVTGFEADLLVNGRPKDVLIDWEGAVVESRKN